MTSITLSETAHVYIKKMLSVNSDKYFRLTIKQTGCSGYSYLPELVDGVSEGDISLVLSGLTILLDAKWQHLLEQLHIDYVEDDKSGIKQKRLIFTNPKESARCGCGESFHV